MMIRPDFNLKQFKNKVSLIHLLKDPYIAVTTGMYISLILTFSH